MNSRHPLVTLGGIWLLLCLGLLLVMLCRPGREVAPVPTVTPTRPILVLPTRAATRTPTVGVTVTPRESVLAPTRTPLPPTPTFTPVPTATPTPDGTRVPTRAPVQKGEGASPWSS